MPPVRRLLPRLSVHRLTEEVGMAVVPRVLLDHVGRKGRFRSTVLVQLSHGRSAYRRPTAELLMEPGDHPVRWSKSPRTHAM
jgi:hypothetical protein